MGRVPYIYCMKKLYILLALAFAINIASAQKQTCNNFKEGYFKIVDENLGTLYIERNKEFQTETGPDGTIMVLKIKWVDDCVYTLELVKYISNPQNFPVDKSMILTVKIMDVSSTSYFQETSSNKFSQVFKSEVKRIKKSDMPK